jgi:hypothetical protein
MHPERKERLQDAINAIKEVKTELYDGLYEEAVNARNTFDYDTDEYSTLDQITIHFGEADSTLEDAITALENVFGEDGADDEPESEDEEESNEDEDSAF